MSMLKGNMIDPAVYKDMPRLTQRERFILINRLCGNVWGGYHSKIAEEFGEEKAVEITKKVCGYVFWDKLLPEISQLLGVDANQSPDLISYGKFIAFIEEEIMGCSVSAMESTSERVVRNHSFCPWGDVMPGGVCKSFMAYMDDLMKPFGFRVTQQSLYCDTGMCRYTTEKEK